MTSTIYRTAIGAGVGYLGWRFIGTAVSDGVYLPVFIGAGLGSIFAPYLSSGMSNLSSYGGWGLTIPFLQVYSDYKKSLISFAAGGALGAGAFYLLGGGEGMQVALASGAAALAVPYLSMKSTGQTYSGRGRAGYEERT